MEVEGDDGEVESSSMINDGHLGIEKQIARKRKIVNTAYISYPSAPSEKTG